MLIFEARIFLNFKCQISLAVIGNYKVPRRYEFDSTTANDDRLCFPPFAPFSTFSKSGKQRSLRVFNIFRNVSQIMIGVLVFNKSVRNDWIFTHKSVSVFNVENGLHPTEIKVIVRATFHNFAYISAILEQI